MANAPLGHANLFEIDINPTGVSSYKRVGDGLVSSTRALNEAVDKKGYLNGNGGTNTEVTGIDYVVSFAGDYIPTDEAQEYIFSKTLLLGQNRHTNFRETWADGTVNSGDCTITIDTPPGGDANATQAIGFSLNFNAMPSQTLPVAATTEAGAFAEGTVIGSTKFTPTTPVVSGNRLAYRISSAEVTSNNREYISYSTPYTSGANISGVAATQYCSIWELDPYNHVVFFTCSILTGVVKLT